MPINAVGFEDTEMNAHAKIKANVLTLLAVLKRYWAQCQEPNQINVLN